MSYPDIPPLSSVGKEGAVDGKEGAVEYKQFVAIPPTYEKITAEQLQILEFSKNGNAEGIRKMAANQPRNRIKSEIIDCEDELGWTPIMWAIEGGHAECITALYKAGADTNKRSLHSIFSGSDVEYELNSLMYATLLAAEDRIGIECVEALLKRRRAQEQTERNYIVDVIEHGLVIKSSALTFVIQMANRQLRPVHLPLIKLLLDNRVNIGDDDFIQFNIQRPEVLKLLLNHLRYDTLYVVTNLDDLPFLPSLITLKYTYKYRPRESEKRKESARLLLDFYTSEELVKRREELGAEPEKEEAAPALFWHAIKYKVPEVVEQCIEENIPFYKDKNIYMSGPNYSWDILRKVLAYREQRGENIKLSSKVIDKIIHDKDFLLKEDLDVDVLTGFGVHHNICAWGDESDGQGRHRYRYQSKIEKVLPRNLDFAIKHGFNPCLWGPILVHVHNQTEFTRAFVFMKTTPIIIDLGGGEYRLPKTDIDVSGVYDVVNKRGRIMNGRVVDADGNVPSQQAWDKHFDDVRISKKTLPFEKDDIVTIQHDEGKMTGQLEKKPQAGWYSLVGHEKAFKVKKDNVSFCDIPAAHVIMTATIHELNFLLLENEDIDELDFKDDYWSAQTAETLGFMTWGNYIYGESVIEYLLTHTWNLSDAYEEDDVFNIIKQFVEQGAFVPKDFCHILLNNAAGFPIQYAILTYDLLRVNCPGYKFGKSEQHEFVNFASYVQNNPPAENPRENILERLKLFEHVLEVEPDILELPLFPIYIPKICELVRKGRDYRSDAYLARFLIYAGAETLKLNSKLSKYKQRRVDILADAPTDSEDDQSDSSDEARERQEERERLDERLHEIEKNETNTLKKLNDFTSKTVDCVQQMVNADFDVNYQHNHFRIPLFYALEQLNDQVLDVFLGAPGIDLNQNINADTELTALESLMLNNNGRDTVRIMIHKMLQDDRVECPFRRHTLIERDIGKAPIITEYLLSRKYFGGPQDKPREWYFDPNTAPNPGYQYGWSEKLQEQGVEPKWQDKEDEYTKKVCTNMPAAAKVVHWRGLALQHLPWRLRKISPVVRKAIRSNGLALQFVTTRHMMSWDIVQDAVIQNWRAYQFLPQKAMYERVKEPVPFEDREDVQELLIYDEKLNEYIHEMFEDFSQGHVYEMEDVIDNIKDVSEREDLDTIAKKILVVMRKIYSSWVSEPYEYRGLPSQSEPGFVIWMRHLFGKNGPHEGEWPEFKEMFPQAAAYVEMNPYTPEGQKEIYDEKSDVRKQKEKEPIKKLRDAVHAQLGKEVDIIHWDDFEPTMFS